MIVVYGLSNQQYEVIKTRARELNLSCVLRNITHNKYLDELRIILDTYNPPIPSIFVDGNYISSVDEISIKKDI